MPFAGFHGLDLIVILVVALLIFGPKKLPEMGNAVGKSIKEFKKGMNELTAAKEATPKEEKPAAYETQPTAYESVIPNEIVKPAPNSYEIHAEYVEAAPAHYEAHIVDADPVPAGHEMPSVAEMSKPVVEVSKTETNVK